MCLIATAYHSIRPILLDSILILSPYMLLSKKKPRQFAIRHLDVTKLFCKISVSSVRFQAYEVVPHVSSVRFEAYEVVPHVLIATCPLPCALYTTCTSS